MTSAYIPQLDLRASPTLWEFMEAPEFARVVFGPFGSGKTTACAAEIYRLALLQEPAPDRYRYTKAMVVRSTSVELRSTTIPTWQSLFPAHKVGSSVVFSAPIRHHIRTPPRGEQPGLDLLVEFIGLDVADDVSKLKSWEGGIIYFNEVSELEKPLWDMATTRVGRYPSIQHRGVNCTRAAIIADTNEPDEDHWLLALEDSLRARPDGFHRIFRQPPALLDVGEDEQPTDVVVTDVTGRYRWRVNPDAENLRHLPARYYQRAATNKDVAWIQRYLQGKRVMVSSGKPVVPDYNDALMTLAVEVLPNVPVVLGYDIGGGTLQPAAVIGQRHPRGPWLVHGEVVAPDMGLSNFAPLVRHALADLRVSEQHLAEGEGWADPAGKQRDMVFETQAIDYLRQAGLPCREAPDSANSIRSRIEAWKQVTTRYIDGRPGLLVHPRCTTLRAGLAGRWHFRRTLALSGGSPVYSERPVKNEYSHPCDAGGYMLLGGGEWRTIAGRAAAPPGVRPGQPIVARSEFDPFSGVL